MPLIADGAHELTMKKTTVYPRVVVDYEKEADGTCKLTVATPEEILVFPMDEDYGRKLGQKMVAPSVVTASSIPAQNGDGAA